MNILHINTVDSGGAFNAAYRFHMQLIELGINSKFLTLKKYESRPHVTSYLETQRSIFRKLIESVKYRQMKGKLKKYKSISSHNNTLATYYRSAYDLTEFDLFQWADIIHLNWVSNFVDIPTFFLNNAKPIIWTLHDLNPLRGMFHYDPNGFNSEQKLDSKLWLKKVSYYKNANIKFIAPSSWMKEEAKIKGIDAELIHYGIKIPNKNKVFEKILINDEPIKVLLIADDIMDERKGIVPFLNFIKEKNIDFKTIIAGRNGEKFVSKNIKYMGRIVNEIEILDLYSKVDVFLNLSNNDNLPNTIIEAMSLGLPVISTKRGGITDLVKDNINGKLFESADYNLIVDFIQKLRLDKNILYDYGYNSKKIVESNFNIIEQTNKYIKTFSDLLK